MPSNKPSLYIAYRHTQDSQFGFNLIELLVVVLIITILAVISTPFFYQVFQDSEAKQVKRTLISALNTSKSQSFTYRQNVILCLADENLVCHRNASEQLLVFFDINNNHSFDNNHDTIITQHFWKLKHGRVHLGAGSRRHYFKFSAATGRPIGHMGHIKYCPHSSDSVNRFQVSFSMVGNIRFKPDAIHPTECPQTL